MPMTYSPGFRLLPEPQGRRSSFFTSSAINLAILAVILVVSQMSRHVLTQHFETTELIVPAQTPPPSKVQPAMPKLPPPPQVPKLAMEAPRIQTPEPRPPEPKPVEMAAKMNPLTVKEARPQIILAPQPKAALTAAMPAQAPQQHVSTRQVHLGETFGVTPNPNARRPATVAAIGNPYGGSEGAAVAPHGVVGSAGIGNGIRAGSNAGARGRVASAGIPGDSGTARAGAYGHVASAGIPSAAAAPVYRQQQAQVQSTALEVLSKPPVRYTQEALALRVQGDVILRVTFLATGQVVVDRVVHGLGHGLDEEARRVAEQIRFRPATRNGRPVNLTTNITITFQLA